MFGSRFRLGVASLLAAAVAALGAGCGEADQPAPATKRQLRFAKPASAPELQRVRAQANELLDGGPEAFEARLAELRGHPIVVNQWASWCGPCRYEFPFFQRLAAKYGHRVAFLGVNSEDTSEEAEAFMEEFPTPYPHYFDPDGDVARVFEGGRAFPTTVFYGSDGELANSHLGAYAEEDQLEADVRALR